MRRRPGNGAGRRRGRRRRRPSQSVVVHDDGDPGERIGAVEADAARDRQASGDGPSPAHDPTERGAVCADELVLVAACRAARRTERTRARPPVLEVDVDQVELMIDRLVERGPRPGRRRRAGRRARSRRRGRASRPIAAAPAAPAGAPAGGPAAPASTTHPACRRRSDPLGRRPGAEDAELPAQLVLLRRRPVGVQDVALVADGVGDLPGRGEAWPRSVVAARSLRRRSSVSPRL